MRKTAIALIMALLITAAAGTQFLDIAFAQFDLPPPPSNPDENPPSINVISPIENQTYNSSDIWLNFTVTKPETWVGDVGKAYGWTGEGHSGLGYFYWGRITSVRYSLDGADSGSIDANDPAWYNTFFQEPLYKSLDFSFNLTGLSGGLHSLIVSAEGETIYGNWSHTTVVGNSEIVNFTITTHPMTPNGENTEIPTAEPFPTTTVVAVSAVAAVVVAAGLLVYFKKRHPKLGGKT